MINLCIEEPIRNSQIPVTKTQSAYVIAAAIEGAKMRHMIKAAPTMN